MYSYHIELNGEVLHVGFNRNLPSQGDRIVRDALEVVSQKIDSGEITGGKRILIDGPQSVPVAYVLSHKLAHLYQVVAILDPKLGSKVSTPNGAIRHKTYIVTSVHGSAEYQVGDLIETTESQKERSLIKVVLCGPAKSGKSCLRDGLKRAILGRLGAPYPYVITACPDGEGSWHQEAYENNQSAAKDYKYNNKADFTPEFAQQAAKWVQGANQLINIIDVGGKTSPENKIIMKEATHAVILSGDVNKFPEWEVFCQELNLKIVAKIHSQLHGVQDEVMQADNWQEQTNELLETAPLLTGSVHRLERGENVSDRPMVKALADVLKHLTKC
ncbi:CRISPR-associated protein Csx3 [Aetokthonos hydrillicola Thurmond2011]|jgi:CRISPR-associated protein Csx3|uniref:CRISPR-associated protein Csx3 n=1 Tax=Aetokthonos hydrillicola Thurmond2011 TaxID=2712845 RepID=A0AAP5I862_9CYAN|nr:CRISPR-associated protein Csx3 [Aetokthonos hydrillicola]MBO3460369.1 CRISPR-associated protein Csx3 [Aetokthonos hydrillicola CCALA 1050]MBW4588364.1 CRISPR-associated protein Csx3 [Aetokthonos hydrillicola CCALA 1050]MDR9896474.1 CRISPR-associated protein Csx3 [Aetokthonos hydrillicola Thurmond2011]